jgi:hypothetical protein
MTEERPRLSRRWRIPLALLGSFLVYALPLPGPHAAPPMGEWIVASISRPEGGQLGLASLAVALVAQALTFGMAWWILGRRVRALALVVFVPVLAATTWWLALGVIPRLTLIDRDPAPENLSWPVSCAVRDATLLAARTEARDPAGRPWLRSGPDASSYALLGDDCSTRAQLAAPPGTMHALAYTTASGATLETTWDMPAQQQRWWFREAPEATPREIVPAPSPNGVPILSDDAAWLVAVERPAPPPEPPRLTLRSTQGEASRVTPLAGLELGTYVPLEARVDGSASSGEVLLSRDEREFLAIDLDGRITWGPLRPEGVDAGSLTFRRMPSGWVAWDAYVEDRPYTVAWDLPAGKGRHVVPRGRGLSSVDVDPAGRWLALSTSPVYNLGGVHDDVIVLELPSGREVFRDSMPPYARSDVAFMGPDTLAYTAWDGSVAETRIIRAPAR